MSENWMGWPDAGYSAKSAWSGMRGGAGRLRGGISSNASAARWVAGGTPWKKLGMGAGAGAAVGLGGYGYMKYRRNRPSSGRQTGFYNGS